MAVYKPGSREDDKAFVRAANLRDKAEAGNIKPLQAAAEAGDAYAQSDFGMILLGKANDAYNRGDLNMRDEFGAQSAKWMMKAAEQGYYVAIGQMAFYYQLGVGVQQDLYQAKAWYQKLVDIEAQYPDFFSDIRATAAKNGRNEPTARQKLQEVQNQINAQEAAKPKIDMAELAQKADAGDAQAQLDLGFAYFQGDGVPQDYAKAAQWFTKAAEQGNIIAQNNMGALYDSGKGVPKDMTKAVAWYTKAADGGNEDAQNTLGNCYRDGDGVPQDYAKAAALFQKAADKGNGKATNSLGTMYHEGKGVPQDNEKALALWQKAVEQGNATANYNLGVIYLDGDGVPQDYQKSLSYLEKALSQGIADAQEPLNEAREKLAAQQKAAAAPAKLLSIICAVVFGLIGLISGGFFGLIILAVIGIFAGSFVGKKFNTQIMASPLGKFFDKK
ncbi:hypothetical protein FACS1894190_16840 [Spirochaetia bacterium]|nr:hypothetical protein FACS1894190_16840 [Spirochaetia bacterium]